jgi:hypothetical protein
MHVGPCSELAEDAEKPLTMTLHVCADRVMYSAGMGAPTALGLPIVEIASLSESSAGFA